MFSLGRGEIRPFFIDLFNYCVLEPHNIVFLYNWRSILQVVSLEEVAMEEKKQEAWTKLFVDCGGLQHLYNILLSGEIKFFQYYSISSSEIVRLRTFASGVLQPDESSTVWDEWPQDCLTMLLKVLCEFGLCSYDLEGGEEAVQEFLQEERFNKPNKSRENCFVLPVSSRNYIVNQI